MRTLIGVFLAVLGAGLASCGSPSAPSLGAPVPLEMPTTHPADGPRFSAGPDGGLVLSWMEPRGDQTTLRFSALAAGRFSTPVDVVTDDRMFVNWADLPSVLRVQGDHWIAHWLAYSADLTYAYGVAVAQSFDGGTSWSEPMLAHTDGTDTEHGFVSLHREPDGVALLWLDGRNTPDAPMTLRSAVITPTGERVREQLVDDAVCDCCQTDVAVSSNGPLAVYRDRSSGEIRDIYLSRMIDGRWQPGERLHEDNWEIAGCPVNGPSIVAHGDDVAIAWFTAAGGSPAVRLIRSADGGETFSDPVEIASGSLAGYVGLARLPGGNLAISWVSRTPATGNQLNLQYLGANGVAGSPLAIATIAQLRVFPQLGYADGSLYLVWTDLEDDGRRLRGIAVDVAAM